MIFKLLPLVIGVLFDIIWCIKYPKIIKKALIFEDITTGLTLYGYNILMIIFVITNFLLQL